MNGKILLSGIFCIVLCSGVFAQSEELLKIIKNAQAEARKNNPETVAGAYEEVLKSNDATVTQKVDAYLDIARVFSGKNKFDDADAEFEKALTLKDLTVNDKVRILTRKAESFFRSNFVGAFASYYTDGIKKAASVYQRIIELPDASNMNKINAYKGLANCYFELMDTDNAEKTLETALKLPGLEPKEKLEAELNLAIAFQRQLKHADALKLFEKILAENILQSNPKKSVETRVAECMYSLGKDNAEIEAKLFGWGHSHLNVGVFFSKFGDTGSAVRIFEAGMEDKKNDASMRGNILFELLKICQDNPRKIIALSEKYIPALIEENKRNYSLYSRLTGWPFSRSLMRDAEHADYVKWVTKHILENPEIKENDKIKYLQMHLGANILTNDLDAAKKNIASLLECKDLKDEQRVQCMLVDVLISSGGKTDGISAGINGVIGKDVEVKKRAEYILYAAKIAMELKFFDIAKQLDVEYTKMLVRKPLPSVACTFIKNGPKDITSFLNSEYFKNQKNHARLDRKYGKNLQFLLETDAAITGRVVTEAKDGEFVPTVFVTSCDEDGVKIFFYSKTDKAKDFADGLTGLGGFEIYFAAGVEAPYHCYLIDPGSQKTGDDFLTQYNNADFRRSRAKDNTLDTDYAVVDGAFALLIKVPWTTFFNQLPENGDKWQFEALHWEQGGYSWGGSESVHYRSRFGNFVFENMTPENLNAIKRRLVVKAANVFRQSVSPRGNGFLERWKDPELGDQEFYFSDVKPLEDKLTGFLGLVKPTMSQKDVEMLYDEAVPQWMNIDFILASMRKDFLDRKRIAGK